MNIVFLSFYSGFVTRGMETVVHELATRLAHSHQTTVIQIGPKHNTDLPYTTIQIPMHMHWPPVNDRGIARKLFIDYYSRQIAKFSFKALPLVKKIKPDIIFPCSGSWSTLIAKHYAMHSKSKLVVCGQAGLGWDDRFNLLLQPDLFIALSKRNLKWAKTHAPKVQMQMIPNGVDLKKFQPELPSELNHDLKQQLKSLRKPVVLCVAGDQKYKRVEDTIRAVAQLPAASLILVRGGRIQLNDQAVMLGKKLLHNNFVSLVSTHDQMPAIYNYADLFTLVSEPTEAFGISYLEALASGLPVVATDDELRREIIQDAGLYISDTADSMTYAQLLSQALTTHWGDKPRQQAAKYDWNLIAKDYETAFAKLLDP